MLIAVTASAESAAQINRIAAAVNFVLMIIVVMFVNEYAESVSYMSFDKRENENEKRKKNEKKRNRKKKAEWDDFEI